MLSLPFTEYLGNLSLEVDFTTACVRFT